VDGYPSGVQDMAISDRVLTAARGFSGQIGDGECWTLVERAVIAAGGVSSRTLTPNFGPQAAYVWGNSANLIAAPAGALIQFSNYRWTRQTTTVVSNTDGSGSTRTENETKGRPHHSAILATRLGGGMFEVIEQNVEGDKTAKTRTLCLQSQPEQVTETVDGEETTTVTVRNTVTGTVTFYTARPAPGSSP
jgi:hypothetical protein